MNYLPTTAKEKKPSQSRDIFTRLSYYGAFDFQGRRFFLSIICDDPLPCKDMAALGGSRHALNNFPT